MKKKSQEPLKTWFAGEFGPVADVQVHVPDGPGIPSVPEAGLNTSKWAKSEPQCQKIQKKTNQLFEDQPWKVCVPGNFLVHLVVVVM